MSEKRLETGSAPEVVVLAHDRLSIRGWDQDAVEDLGAGKGTRLTLLEGSTVEVTADERLDLRVPQAASLVVTGFDEIVIREVAGEIRVEQAGSDVTLRDVGPVSVNSVADDLTARSVNGALTAGQIGRYLNVKDISGDLKIDYTDGHVNVRGVSGELFMETGGNANLNLVSSEVPKVFVKAAGVINCRVSEDLNARVVIRSGGPVSVRAADVPGTPVRETFEHVFGAGEGVVELIAEGPVSLTASRGGPASPDVQIDFDLGEELSGLGAGIGEQLSGQFEAMGEALQARMESLTEMFTNLDLSVEQSERIQKHTQEKINRAQEKIRRAQDRAARKIADAQRRAEQESRRAERRAERRSFNINLGDLKRSARNQSDPVTDEERLMILNMVAENKITLEEAETLLAALDGK